MYNLFEQAQLYLSPKDGYKHILMLRTGGRYRREANFFDADYNIQINDLLYFMQINGYEIIDVKISALSDTATVGYPTGYQTLIIYR